MCSLKSNLRVSAHWFIRESAWRKSWQRRLNSSAPCTFQLRRCHPIIDWNIARMSSWNKSNYFFLPSPIMEIATRKNCSYLRQRRQSLLLHIPKQLVDGKLKAFVDVEFWHVDSYQDPAFPGGFGWRLVIFERRLIGTHRQVYFHSIDTF